MSTLKTLDLTATLVELGRRVEHVTTEPSVKPGSQAWRGIRVASPSIADLPGEVWSAWSQPPIGRCFP